MTRAARGQNPQEEEMRHRSLLNRSKEVITVAHSARPRWAALAAMLVAGPALLTGCGEPLIGGAAAPEKEESFHDAYLTLRKEEAGLRPEDIQDIRPIRTITLDEADGVMATCMTEHGFAPVKDGGALSYEIPEEQDYAWNLADYTCNARYPVDEYLAAVPGQIEENPHVLEKIHRHQVEHTVPCLEARGYTPERPPSLETYIEQSIDTRWDPIRSGTAVSSAIERDKLAGKLESYQEVYEACPMTPPHDVLYGDTTP